MNEKQDLRIQKSRKAIKTAFLELIKEKGYANITITDISKRAMINRKTFYMHFETKENLYNSVAEDFMEVVAPTLENIRYLKGSEQRKYFIAQLLKVRENKEIFKTLTEDNTNQDFVIKFKKKLSYDLVSQSHIDIKTKNSHFTTELLAEAYFSIFMTFAKWWIDREDVSEDDLLDMIIEFFSKRTLELLGVDFNK